MFSPTVCTISIPAECLRDAGAWDGGAPYPTMALGTWVAAAVPGAADAAQRRIKIPLRQLEGEMAPWAGQEGHSHPVTSDGGGLGGGLRVTQHLLTAAKLSTSWLCRC